jgi:hypothetical protein
VGVDTQKVSRTLTVFSNITDEFVAEHELIGFDLSKFKQQFDSKVKGAFETDSENYDPLMYGCYPVDAEDIEFIRSFLADPVNFDFVNFAYFVEATAVVEDQETESSR